MLPSPEHWGPKVHPLTREVEAEDPMELMANPVHGDPEVMLQCIVEEFAWMGMEANELLGLFHSPMYPVLNQLLEHFGEEAVRQRVQTLLGGAGVLFRVQETIAADPLPEDEDEPVLVQLSLRKREDM